MQLGRRMRYWFLAVLWGGLFTCMSTRLVYLACYQRGFLLGQSKARVERKTTLSARRGRILDRNGNILAMSKPTYDLWISPRIFIKDKRSIAKIAKLVSTTEQDLQKKINENIKKDFMYIARNIDEASYHKIQREQIDEVYSTQTYTRFYPGGKASAQLLGLVDRDEKGIEGIEYMYNESLSGKSGSAKYVINPFGETVETIARLEPEAGKNIKLTIDRSIQYLTYEALKEGVKKFGAKSAHALVLDVASGDIIAATNYPSFNPEIEWHKKRINSSLARNKVITDLYEPGSTFKPISMAYAIENSKLDVNAKISTSPGVYKIGENIIKDVRNFGQISLDEVLIKSSNIAIAKLILQSERGFDSWLINKYKVLEKAIGGFPGEPRGRIIQKKKISDFEIATMSFGYGLSMTPLQLGKMYLMLANGGEAQSVNLIYGKAKGQKKERVLKKETVKRIHEMLHQVTLPKGTARKAKVSGIKVAGKTGTTHVYENGKYQKDRYIASFAGYAPFEDPQYVVVIVVEEPDKAFHYGGLSAAPIFSKIIFNSQFISKSPKEKQKP